MILLQEIAGATAILTLNRPDRRNALSLELMRELLDAFDEIGRHPQVRVVVLAAAGPVFSAGHDLTEMTGRDLAATCDLAIAAETARFGTPGVKIGLFCSTPMVALSRAIGRKRALEMLLTGELIDAQTAADWGLVNRVAPPAALRTETLALANKIAKASAQTVAMGKQAFYTQIDLDQPQAYAYAKEVMAMNATTADAQEGILAFLRGMRR